MPQQKPALSNLGARKEFLEYKSTTLIVERRKVWPHFTTSARTECVPWTCNCETERKPLPPDPAGVREGRVVGVRVSGVHMGYLDFHLSKQPPIAPTPKHGASIDHMWRQNSHPAQQRWRTISAWVSWKLRGESGLLFPLNNTQWHSYLFSC